MAGKCVGEGLRDGCCVVGEEGVPGHGAELCQVALSVGGLQQAHRLVPLVRVNGRLGLLGVGDQYPVFPAPSFQAVFSSKGREKNDSPIPKAFSTPRRICSPSASSVKSRLKTPCSTDAAKRANDSAGSLFLSLAYESRGRG